MQSFDIINRDNAEYIDRLFQLYQQDSRSVDEKWRAFFAGFEAGTTKQNSVPSTCPTCEGKPCPIASNVSHLVHSYRELGHYVANLDPLGHNRPTHPLLELSQFGFNTPDLDIYVGNGTFRGNTDGTLRDLIEKLRATYCRTIGVEYLSIPDKAQREWLEERMEPILNRPTYSREQARQILAQLVATQGFEEFLHTRYIGQKRFSIEGGETLIPLLNTIIEDASTLGVDEIVMGMTHRGRLNVLANVLNKPAEIIFSEFEGMAPRQENEGDGDVKYHLGYSHDRVTASGRKVHLSLSNNPSHLELIDPVMEGIVRAKQFYLRDESRSRVVPILMHGDAAFTGQGIVSETLSLSQLDAYRTGGTLHIIINNQIGFTTLPNQERFTTYPTDVARMIPAPIFHVNGDDPEAVVHVARLAIAFRQQFRTDVFIDLWCYRKFGHNETDEPSFTQPVMYREITQHTPVRDLYARQLIDQHKLTPPEFDAMKSADRQKLEQAQTLAKESRPRQSIMTLGGVWNGITRNGNGNGNVNTAVAAQILRTISERCTQPPQGFTVHPKLQRFLAARLDMASGKAPIDWGCAEMLSLGSLLLEGTPVRFTGQDAERGTFSHRHAVLFDYNNGQRYVPLANLSSDQAPIMITNTMLSELAVLGFEYGYSMADPRNLVIWEAQFGDFVNGAEPIIDQFIISSESKWQRMSGLVMLLPHGYEGQGPEHSNAYLARFLALCAEENIQVCYPSVPAQYFHLLRRQMKRPFRKPLVLMMPKSLLRHEMSTSRLEELTNDTFHLVFDDPAVLQRDRVRRVLLCSGKVYFLLHAARQKHRITDVAIVRVEQLYPLPRREIQSVLGRYRHARQIAWVQEEPRNRGAWRFMKDHLIEMLPDASMLGYFGRGEAASPATGSFRLHQIEEEELIRQALELTRGPLNPPALVPAVQPGEHAQTAVDVLTTPGRPTVAAPAAK